MVMNAGAYGGEMKDVAAKVKVLTPQGEMIELGADEMEVRPFWPAFDTTLPRIAPAWAFMVFPETVISCIFSERHNAGGKVVG